MSRFPLFTASVPMIGRTRIFERICSDLTKPTPQHFSVVGPRYFGKTVLLDTLAETMRATGKFECVLSWDLGHQTPQTDAEFLAALRRKVAEGFKDNRRDLHDYLIESESGYAELREVIDTLSKEAKRILMLWDGFDRPLREGQLTRNLWDNLLELCRQDGLVLVTATRRKLQELIRDEKSVTSEFWQVFEPVQLGPMDDVDCLAFTGAMPEFSFQQGALAELTNWTGGIPPLLAGLLNQISHTVHTGTVTNGHVNAAASQLEERIVAAIESIWTDLSGPAADLFRLLCERREVLAADTGKEERSILLANGLARQVTNKLVFACRLLERHANETAAGGTSLERFFGNWEDYKANIGGILERRVGQIQRFDDRLFRMVERGAADIPDYPDDCLNNLTHIEERALDLIWQKETGADGRIPQAAVNYWMERPESFPKVIADKVKSDDWSVPQERHRQLALLQLLTGSHQHITNATARHVTKDTYVLLNAIHSFRNRSQHAAGQSIHLGVAVSAIMLCIELLACLSRELERGPA